MTEEVIEVLAEEAFGTLHGLPPGMITAARVAGFALSTESSGPSSSQSRIGNQNDNYHLDVKEERIASSLVAVASRTIAKEYGTDYSRIRREEIAKGAVKVIADAPGSISSQDATQTLLSGTHSERIRLIRELSEESVNS